MPSSQDGKIVPELPVGPLRGQERPLSSHKGLLTSDVGEADMCHGVTGMLNRRWPLSALGMKPLPGRSWRWRRGRQKCLWQTSPSLLFHELETIFQATLHLGSGLHSGSTPHCGWARGHTGGPDESQGGARGLCKQAVLMKESRMFLQSQSETHCRHMTYHGLVRRGFPLPQGLGGF